MCAKTSLLNHILNSPCCEQRFAIIVNEVGEVGLDDSVLKWTSEDQVVETVNGCLCCAVRSDLVHLLLRLAATEIPRFDALIIETKGLADPAPMAQTFLINVDIKKEYRLDGIVTVIDAEHALQSSDEFTADSAGHGNSQGVQQVAFADRILLNKIDLVDEEGLDRLETRLRGINNQADIFRTSYAKVDPRYVVSIDAFSPQSILALNSKANGSDYARSHDPSAASVSFKFEGELNAHCLIKCIHDLLNDKGGDLLRYNGVLAVKGMDQKFLFHGIHMSFQGDYSPENLFESGEPRECSFNFIGRDLDRSKLEKGSCAWCVTRDRR